MEQHKDLGHQAADGGQGFAASEDAARPVVGAASTEQEASLDPEVTRVSMLSMQVCVPEHYTDAQAETFANQASPTGSDTLRWAMRHNGDESLAGASERVKCEKRCGCVHIMLDC